MNNKKPIVIYAEKGDKTLVSMDGYLPFVSDTKDLSNIIDIVGGSKFIFEDFIIDPNAKGIDPVFYREHQYSKELGVPCKILFIKGDFDEKELKIGLKMKHFRYEDGYKLLPYLSGMHKALFLNN